MQRAVRPGTKTLSTQCPISGADSVHRDASQGLAWLPASLFRTVSGLQHASGTSRNVAANGKARRDGLPDAGLHRLWKIPDTDV